MRLTHSPNFVALALVLGGCATLPDNSDRTHSTVWATPAETTLGQSMASTDAAVDGQSGVLLLGDGAAAFRARYGLARMAEQTLDMQYYLWQPDLTGKLLLHAAIEAADRGVRVRLLLDDIYSGGRDAIYATLDTHPRIELRVFNPLARRGIARGINFVANMSRLDHRMHNKVFVADGAVAIVGGRNIGDHYFGVDPDYNFRDLDVLVSGHAAIQAGGAFDLYWNSDAAFPVALVSRTKPGEDALATLREELRDALARAEADPERVERTLEEHHVTLERLRSALRWVSAEVIVDPLTKIEKSGVSAFASFAQELTNSLESELVIQTAYLIPGDEGVANLAQLVDRGVQVRLLTNSLVSNNHLVAFAGYKRYRKPLVAAGVELRELRADARLRRYFRAYSDVAHAALHTKALVADGETVLIGSYNFDPRSRDLNTEIGLVVRDARFAAEVLEHMAVDESPANSYSLRLDERDRLEWLSETDGVETIERVDPLSSAWQRFAAGFLGMLPIESKL